MKKYLLTLILLLFASTSWATTYYVDSAITDTNVASATPDFTTYNPTTFATDTGSSSVYKTIADVNLKAFAAGDSVLFRKGQTWREQLTVPSSGTDGHPITFGAYGSGANPIITPSKLMTGWSLYSGNIYSVSYISTAYSVWEDNTYLTKVASLDALISVGEWYIDTTNHLLYIWTLDGSDPNNHTIEVASTAGTEDTAITLSSKSYITIDNLILEKHSGNAVKGLIGGTTSSYITMSNLEVRYGGYQGYGIMFNTNGSHNTVQDSTIHDIRNTGIYFSNGVDYPTIQRCTVYNIGQNDDVGDNGGITIGGGTTASSYATIENNELYNIGYAISAQSHNQTILIDRGGGTYIVRYNKIHDCVKGGIYVVGYAGSHSDGIQIYYNLVYNINAANNATYSGNAPGIGTSNADNVWIYNNVIWNIGTGATYGAPCMLITGTVGETLDNTIIENNVIGPSTGTKRRHYSARGNSTFTDFVSNYNCFYDSVGYVLYDAANNYTTVADFNTATGFEANSIVADPLFVSATDFRLQSGSPAKDTGVSVGLTKDYIGNYVPYNTTPDIGAYEYPSHPMTTIGTGSGTVTLGSGGTATLR